MRKGISLNSLYAHILAYSYCFRDLVAHLKERDRVSTPLAFSAASVPLTAPSEFQLVTPAPPFPCNQEDYADVRFWTRAEWTEYERKENAKGVRPNKLSFITQEDGSFIPRDRLSAMTREAQKLWGSLYRTRDDPHSWGNKTKTASDYFSNSMCLKFEEFRWCADDWKIEAFATIKFPDWARYSRSSGTLPRKPGFLQYNDMSLLIFNLFRSNALYKQQPQTQDEKR